MSEKSAGALVRWVTFTNVALMVVIATYCALQIEDAALRPVLVALVWLQSTSVVLALLR